MRVLVTAGGTREPIDDVRVIANSSTGRLGACLADALAAAGHEVLLLHGSHAARPERDAVRCQAFGASSELGELLRRHVPGQDAVVHAAAVADFVPERAAGKISSDAQELVLRLVRAPKLIDELRDLAPAAVLVGFKLTSGKSEAERLDISRALLRRARLDLVVSNDAGRIGDDHEAWLVSAEAVEARAVGKPAIAAALVRALNERRSERAQEIPS